MLLYILAHQKMIYAPIRDKLQKKMLNKAKETLLAQMKRNILYVDESNESTMEDWTIPGGDNEEKLTYFINLGLRHTIEISKLMDQNNLPNLMEKLKNNRSFCLYNRQYQMLYYGDLSIQGEDKRRALNPESDTVYKGFDFHNCFNYLYVKLNSEFKYPLREFDLFTICDLVYSRLNVNKDGKTVSDEKIDTFFYRDLFKEKARNVLEQTIKVLDNYLNENDKTNICLRDYFTKAKEDFMKELISRCE